MTDAIITRGPDGGDVWLDSDVPLALGHRRLSIIDLSPEGAQPMISASGRYVITYNGEVYNFQDLRRDLDRVGALFRGRSDTEVILAAIENWGLNLTLQKINGMFAFALWDKKEKTLHFVRDRLGKKPLYIGWAGSGSRASLVFGSELKALRAHPDFAPELSRGSLALYMRYGYVPAPHCIYQQVWTLLPGHWLSLDLEKINGAEDLQTQMKPYWNPLNILQESRAHPCEKTQAGIVEEFDHLLGACTRERMVSDVPLGAFLSGGIDSSAVVAMMQNASARPVKTYTIGFHEAGFNEAQYAKKVANHLGTDHHELYLSGRDALDIIPQMSQIYDERCAEISGIPTYLVSKFARRDVTVALSGDGGDEMLGGYSRHRDGPRIWKKIRRIPKPLRKAMGFGMTKLPAATLDRIFPFIPQAGAKIHKVAEGFGVDTADQIFMRLIGRWQDPAALVRGACEPVFPMTDPAWQPRGDLSFSEHMMYKDTLSYLPNDILVKIDRASMATSLECRAPLLDRRIYEYAWRLPEHYKIRAGQGKWLLRQVLSRYVPAELFERPKQGFAIPVGERLSGPLRDWAEILLDETRLRDEGYFDPALIRRQWDDHLQGRGSHSVRLWTVLMFQAWKEKWMP